MPCSLSLKGLCFWWRLQQLLHLAKFRPELTILRRPRTQTKGLLSLFARLGTSAYWIELLVDGWSSLHALSSSLVVIFGSASLQWRCSYPWCPSVSWIHHGPLSQSLAFRRLFAQASSWSTFCVWVSNVLEVPQSCSGNDLAFRPIQPASPDEDPQY